MTPSQARFVIIGAGIHGLSTAWHLARRLKATGKGSGQDVLVIDKKGIAAGASGVACGVIRNNYFQPAMRELMAHSVDIWESDPAGFSYHPVGYLQIAPEAMRADVGQIYTEQQAIGYTSELVDGVDACRSYLTGLFDDWQAPGTSVVLHEKRGGYANNAASMRGLAAKATAEGVTIRAGVTVTGLSVDDGAVTAVQTDQGDIACEQLVVAAGPWVRDFWAMLDLPSRLSITTPDGVTCPDVPMWTYWALQEGTLNVDLNTFTDNQGNLPPVVHVDSSEPLYDDIDGELNDQMWGIHYKPDFSFGGVQGGAAPVRLDRPAEDIAVDPYGPDSPEFVIGEDFIRIWTSALAHCQKRFHSKRELYKRERSGGIGRTASQSSTPSGRTPTSSRTPTTATR